MFIRVKNPPNKIAKKAFSIPVSVQLVTYYIDFRGIIFRGHLFFPYCNHWDMPRGMVLTIFLLLHIIIGS